MIARCRGVVDICDAVKLARALNMEVAVRGGGHNVAGHATIEGGLMIDLAPMKGIYVDPNARVARAQGGVLWTEFNRETQVHGLATTGGVVGSTGIAGLTLGGGLAAPNRDDAPAWVTSDLVLVPALILDKAAHSHRFLAANTTEVCAAPRVLVDERDHSPLAILII